MITLRDPNIYIYTLKILGVPRKQHAGAHVYTASTDTVVSVWRVAFI